MVVLLLYLQQAWHGAQKLCNSISASPLLEEEINYGIAAIFMVEEDEQRPVHEPGSLLQLCEDWSKGVGVNDVLQLRQII